MGNFEFKKKFGQNFLTDSVLLEEIVEKAGVTEEDVVLEIGAGKGALTEVLSRHAKRVVAFEIDRELKAFLTEKFDNTNVKMMFEDIMNISDAEVNVLMGGKFKLVANLPYYITSPIVTRFLKNVNLVSLTVMVQEEVADRIVASAGGKEYGVLSLMCQIFGEPHKLIRVGREKFTPVPNVDSAVVRIDRYDSPKIDNFEEFIEFIKTAFKMRRKKLSANLENSKLSKADIENLLISMGLSASARAEELTWQDFEQLFAYFLDKNK